MMGWVTVYKSWVNLSLEIQSEVYFFIDNWIVRIVGSEKLVTKMISKVEFVSTARIGDIIEIGTELISLGTTSLTLSCVVRNKKTTNIITQVSDLVFVHVDSNGTPKRHGISEPTKDIVSELKNNHS